MSTNFSSYDQQVQEIANAISQKPKKEGEEDEEHHRFRVSIHKRSNEFLEYKREFEKEYEKILNPVNDVIDKLIDAEKDFKLFNELENEYYLLISRLYELDLEKIKMKLSSNLDIEDIRINYHTNYLETKTLTQEQRNYIINFQLNRAKEQKYKHQYDYEFELEEIENYYEYIQRTYLKESDTDKETHTEKCSKSFEWFPKDLIVHNGICYSIPELVAKFDRNDFTDPFNNYQNFDQTFIQKIRKYYTTDEYRAQKFIKKQLGDLTEHVFYIDKELHDQKNPVRVVEDRKPQLIIEQEDIRIQFYKHFKLISNGLVDPIDLVKEILKINPISTCAECKTKVENEGVQSIQDQTNGENVKIAFCSFGCMSKHKFVTRENLTEIPPLSQISTNLVSSLIDLVVK